MLRIMDRTLLLFAPQLPPERWWLLAPGLGGVRN